MKTGVLEQILCDVDASPLPERSLGMDITSDWGLLPQPNIVKQKACKSALRLVLLGARWEPLKLPEPAQVLNLNIEHLVDRKSSPF